jgi:uncharacterized protein
MQNTAKTTISNTSGKKASNASSAKIYTWSRWIHLYTSMVSLLVVLFFSATGITLNHPEWIFGTQQVSRDYTGTLPKNWLQNGVVSWLVTAETLRAKYGLKGRVSDNRNDDQQASISFRAPAYGADAFINMSDGAYKLTVNSQGAVAVLNDLHRGRDAGGAWAWVIDVSGGFLLIVAFSGLAMSLFMKKTRTAALITAGGGAILVLALMWLTN